MGSTLFKKKQNLKLIILMSIPVFRTDFQRYTGKSGHFLRHTGIYGILLIVVYVCRIISALKEQADVLTLTSRAFYNDKGTRKENQRY